MCDQNSYFFYAVDEDAFICLRCGEHMELSEEWIEPTCFHEDIIKTEDGYRCLDCRRLFPAFRIVRPDKSNGKCVMIA